MYTYTQARLEYCRVTLHETSCRVAACADAFWIRQPPGSKEAYQVYLGAKRVLLGGFAAHDFTFGVLEWSINTLTDLES